MRRSTLTIRVVCSMTKRYETSRSFSDPPALLIVASGSWEHIPPEIRFSRAWYDSGSCDGPSLRHPGRDRDGEEYRTLAVNGREKRGAEMGPAIVENPCSIRCVGYALFLISEY